MSETEINSTQKEKQLTKPGDDTKLSNWMIALGVGITTAVAVTAVVYYTKREKAKKQRGYRTKNTVSSYSSTLNKYWGIATTTFATVRIAVSNLLNKEVQHKPMVASDEDPSPFSDQELIVDHDESEL
jgi:cytochrome c-type biogenesis protein CcmH/NrfG